MTRLRLEIMQLLYNLHDVKTEIIDISHLRMNRVSWQVLPAIPDA